MSTKCYLYFFNAYGGDFFWLRWGETAQQTANLIIDSGYSQNYWDIRKVMNTIHSAGQQVDGVVLTHIDNDHIGGFMRWLNRGMSSPPVRNLFFNTGRGLAGRLVDPNKTSAFPAPFEDEARFVGNGLEYSATKAFSILDLLKQKNMTDILISDSLCGTKITLPMGAVLRFISPSIHSAEMFLKYWKWAAEEAGCDYGSSGVFPSLDELALDTIQFDTSPTNGGSLAFLFDYGDTHLAFLGDAHADVCENGLRALGYSETSPYPATVVKLSHHGSVANLSDRLLKLLSGDRFILSSSEGKFSKNQKASIAKLLHHREHIVLYTNFHIPDRCFSESDRSKYIGTGKLVVDRLEKNTVRQLEEWFSLCGGIR